MFKRIAIAAGFFLLGPVACILTSLLITKAHSPWLVPVMTEGAHAGTHFASYVLWAFLGGAALFLSFPIWISEPKPVQTPEQQDHPVLRLVAERDQLRTALVAAIPSMQFDQRANDLLDPMDPLICPGCGQPFEVKDDGCHGHRLHSAIRLGLRYVPKTPVEEPPVS